MQLGPIKFREVVLVDFEYSISSGDRPDPVCLVAYELVSGRKIRIWQDELRECAAPPYPIERDCLLVAYYASADIGCHLALNWQLPANVLDPFVEFRLMTNGRPPPCGAGLLGALTHYGLDSMAAVEKTSMRELALRGGPWTEAERQALLDYCEMDVAALARLLPRMLPDIDLPRALLRGRYMRAAAQIEHQGVPIDTAALAVLREHWDSIQGQLIERIDADYHVFEGRKFKAERWARWLAEHDIPWPRLPSGSLALDDETFREMARSHPRVAPIRELRVSLSQMRLEDLAVGSDGRNRCMLSAFRAKTGRNQPSNVKFIFGPAVWLRSLIRPNPGSGLAYIDWEQQEFGIAAALSGDPTMIAAYQSGDPYLAFGKQAGAVPADATKRTHGAIREQFKACALAVQYGMGAESLAGRIGRPVVLARELLRLHRETYRKFWQWSDGAVDYAMLTGRLFTVFGWTLHVGPNTNSRSLRNFPMQANGAEMLRLACCLATERGIRVCAPIHDAILVEAPLDDLNDAVRAAQGAMAEASSVVLDGFRLRTEASLVRYPYRYQDKRGNRMWDAIWGVLEEMAAPRPVQQCTPDLCTSAAIPAHGSTPALSYLWSP